MSRCGGWIAATLLGLAGCAADRPAARPATVELFDGARGRRVPVALYGVGSGAKPLAVIAHGYGVPATGYSFLAESLARRGFAVAAVQLDLPGDPAPATSGDIRALRMPIWRRGADSVAFAIVELRARGVADGRPAVLVGHSQGGDVAMLLAGERPGLLRAALSLDNRRMPLPRVARPRICSLRSSDLPADPGVLPDAVEARRLGMRITRAAALRHDTMTDAAGAAGRAVLLSVLADCLHDRSPSAPG